jgi:hypothetical protein
VTLSYRGQPLTRAQAKNRERVNEYIKRGRVKAFMGSQVVRFGANDVVLRLAAGNEVKLPNDAAFVLIGADAPVAWLEKVGVSYVERPHWYALGATDQLVESLLGKQPETPREAERAAALVLSRAPAPPRAETLPPAPEASVDGGRRPLPAFEQGSGVFTSAQAPMTLEQFARSPALRQRPRRPRDAEATRLLRGLRDEGARLAHDETSVSIVTVASAEAARHDDPTRFSAHAVEDTLDPDDLVEVDAPPAVRPTPAVIVGLAGRGVGLAGRGVGLAGRGVELAGRAPQPHQTPRRRNGFAPAPTQITSPAMLDRLRRDSLAHATPEESTVQVSLEDQLEWDDDDRTVHAPPPRLR